MPFTSSTRTLSSRSIPLLTASALSVTLYVAHTHLRPVLAESLPLDPSTSVKKVKSPVTFPPFTPVGWGSNKNLTLLLDGATGAVKRPVSITKLGSTPLRDLVLAETYGACVDANGDSWIWGSGYDASGEIGRALRGKSLKTLAPAKAKVFALSKHGRLYVFSPSKSIHSNRQDGPRSWWFYLFGTDAGIDHVELQAAGGLGWNERWVGVSAGRDHLLAVTSKGRTFSLPLSPKGNSNRQLGTKQELEPVETLPGQLTPEQDIRYCTTLTPIPSLASIDVAQVATSERTSFVRTKSCHVLGFGANEVGQIGLGASLTVDTVPVPVEVVLAKCYPVGTRVECTDVKAGGNTTFYKVKRSFPGRRGEYEDLLACGGGLQGILGTGAYTSASGMPVKVKTISGLQEYSEKAKTFFPVGIQSLSVSQCPTPHAFAVLDTLSQAESTDKKQGAVGKDVMGWGANVEYQVGMGKRSSAPVPQYLPPLGAKISDDLSPDAQSVGAKQSLMPHMRLQLKSNRTNAYDLEGKLLRRRVKCEETIVAGWNASVLYSKIVE
ncbi:hypothetical protein IAT38_000910 [Cryptococcus sp. DSM 104549]